MPVNNTTFQQHPWNSHCGCGFSVLHDKLVRLCLEMLRKTQGFKWFAWQITFHRKFKQRPTEIPEVNPNWCMFLSLLYLFLSKLGLHWKVDLHCEPRLNEIQLELTWTLFWCKIQSFCKFILSSTFADLLLVNPVEGE